MSMPEIVSQTNFGKPIENIRLNFKLERKHFKSKEKIMDAGIALYVAEVMQQQNWYYTTENFLVCGEQSGLGIKDVEVIIDNDAFTNMQWLVKQFKRFDMNFRPHIDGFLVCIRPHPRRDVLQCFLGSLFKPTDKPYDVF